MVGLAVFAGLNDFVFFENQMIDPLVLGCMACALGSPQLFAIGLFLGSPVSCYLFLRPYHSRIKKKWGMPRCTIVDFSSLLLLTCWPLLIAMAAKEHVSVPMLLLSAFLLLGCVVFIWVRCMWLLQQNQVNQVIKRTVFIGALFPLIVFFGVATAYFGLLIMLAVQFGRFPIMEMLVILVVGTLVWMGVSVGLRYVFKKDDQNEVSEFTADGEGV